MEVLLQVVVLLGVVLLVVAIGVALVDRGTTSAPGRRLHHHLAATT